MSTESGSPSTNSSGSERSVTIGTDGEIEAETFRLLALGCVLVLTATYVSVLRDVTRVVGGTQSLFMLVAVMLVVATVLARLIRPRTALLAALIAAGAGFGYYLEASGVGVGVLTEATGDLLGDVLLLATGLEIMRMVEAGLWTLGFAPGPVFLSWYLAMRGRYGLSVLPGGFALLFLVLTGDAGTGVTLLGVLAAIGAVGFGELESRGGAIAQADLLAVLFAVIIVLSLSVTLVPGGETTPDAVSGSGAETGQSTLEGTIDSSPERSGISGSVELSPEVRFTVESPQESYWRTGVYDRYTGDEWVRSGQQSQDFDSLEPPAGTATVVPHRVTAETELDVMPVAPQLVGLEDEAAQYADLSEHDQPHPSTTLLEGDQYIAESAIPNDDPTTLNAAGTAYPEDVTDHYLQTPETLSDEFHAYTADITADAETPYETATAIEQYLRTSKDYSLEVDRPDGDVADEFLLEMDEGYCVYFATAMTQMLRSEDIPARYVSGYTSGQEVSENEYVVRGLDAHAWVEVYFPDHGWVEFEPTPPSDRDQTHDAELVDARNTGQTDIDTDESEDVPITDDEDSLEEPNVPDGQDEHSENESETDPDDPESEEEANETDPETAPEEEETEGENTSQEESEAGSGAAGEHGSATDTADHSLAERISLTRETAALLAVMLFGVVAGVHRIDATTRLRRTLGLYWHGRRTEPTRDAERAFDRLEGLLARDYRPRRPSESPRQYLTALSATENTDSTLADDERTAKVLECYERAVYGAGITHAEATAAIEAVDGLARERLPGIGSRSPPPDE
ncbi:DUF4129 domain-containing protein [Natronolimnobius sp. AArcel1]|uniref:transglutaminaseTgpA domain-containing protein n=1 Tax=Natronolimnobius sp. AArcel1 TaxID=1679093 RepID=UPI0013EAA188|nr:DUF4129 domain-containing protein [Natronolimnobius sp. AArcel1]